jgi:CubicO group peptidase (beta-lactamase class C family)
VLLAEVVEQVSGESLPDFLSSRIFRPLHLTMVMDPEPANPQKALSYAKDANGSRRWTPTGNWSVLAASTPPRTS